MMVAVWFCLAVLFLLAGHVLRLLRWTQFIEVYERPHLRILLRSLSAGFLVNFFVPWRIGEICRAVMAGRSMDNGVAFALGTIIVERFLDVVVAGILFAAFAACGVAVTGLADSAHFYFAVACILVLLAAFLLRFSSGPKWLIRHAAAVFNQRIQLRLLYFSWTLISTFKDMYQTLSRRRLVLLTMEMWAGYLLSYLCFAACMTALGTPLSLSAVFSSLLSSQSFHQSAFFIGTESAVQAQWLFYVYIGLPLGALWLASYLPARARRLYQKVYHVPQDYLQMLPQLRMQDRLSFLEGYFSGRNREQIQAYLQINRGIQVLRDYSAGSNATTMLCMSHDKTFFRKYAFDQDGEKLYEQLVWLHEQEGRLPLPEILHEVHENRCCCYDMTYSSEAQNFFDFIHSVSPERSWHVLERVLDCLQKGLYDQTMWTPQDDAALRKYIANKVEKNLFVIRGARQFRELIGYDTVIINGVPYPNLQAYAEKLSPAYLYEVFRQDAYATIHGDMTIENIICRPSAQGEDDFYIIDPNTGNLHESPFLDYGKLLQSLHGGYEFLMKTESVRYRGNRIDFLYTKSMAYENLLASYEAYLHEHFTPQDVRSIHYHEIVHWLRLLPYKIRKNGDRALIFYAGLLWILHDICGKDEVV